MQGSSSRKDQQGRPGGWLDGQSVGISPLSIVGNVMLTYALLYSESDTKDTA
jgi:hypothetical protein